MIKYPLKDLRVGDTFPTMEGYIAIVVEIHNALSIVISYNDSHPYTFIVRLEHLKNGRIKNPFHPTSFGIGYLGVGQYVTSINDVRTVEASVWYSMLRRCYCSDEWERRPSYENAKVCTEWHNFQNFAHWYCTQPEYGFGYQIDKDILYPGNRLYSPMTCCMVPLDINNAMQIRGKGYHIDQRRNNYCVTFREKYVGAYSTEQEAQHVYIECRRQHIINLAHQWEKCISTKVYDAMLDFADDLSVKFWYAGI